jgi:hypothetical protein
MSLLVVIVVNIMFSLLACDAMQYGREVSGNMPFIFNPNDGGIRFHSNHWYLSTRLNFIIPTKTAILRKKHTLLTIQCNIQRLQEPTAIKMNCKN